MTVLERLAERYGNRTSLYGIKIVKEPLTAIVWDIFNIEERYKAVVFHGGFDIYAWKDFMQEDEFQNVVLDTHQYFMIAEGEGCEQEKDAYVKYIEENYLKKVEEMSQYFPVICGEWSLFNSAGCGEGTAGGLGKGNRTFLLEL